MEKRKHRVLMTSLAAALVATGSAAQAGVFKCTSASGEVYFSDVACPADYNKQQLELRDHMPQNSAKARRYDPYSVMEQVRRIDKRTAAASRKDSRRSHRAGSGPSSVDQSKLRTIEDALEKTERKIVGLLEDLRWQSGIRARWTREELAEARLERNRILREKTNIHARK